MIIMTILLTVHHKDAHKDVHEDVYEDVYEGVKARLHHALWAVACSVLLCALLGVASGLVLPAFAQSSEQSSAQQHELEPYRKPASSLARRAQQQLDSHRIGINKPAMLVLGAWAAGNMLLNGALMLGSGKLEDRTAFSFQQMNVLWNVVNLGLAASGYWGSLTENPALNTLAQSVEKQSSIEALLLLNAGLDVAYMLGGAWMLERARSTEALLASGSSSSPSSSPLSSSPESQRWRGFGQSLLLQGGFLFVFDVVVYALHHAGGAPLLESALQAAQGLSLGTDGAGGIRLALALQLR
jgi:hypothetical protein